MWPVLFCCLCYHQGKGRGGEGGEREREFVLIVSHQVEREKYETGVKWLHNLLFSLQFSSERVAVVATKMVNDVAR